MVRSAPKFSESTTHGPDHRHRHSPGIVGIVGGIVGVSVGMFVVVAGADGGGGGAGGPSSSSRAAGSGGGRPAAREKAAAAALLMDRSCEALRPSRLKPSSCRSSPWPSNPETKEDEDGDFGFGFDLSV